MRARECDSYFSIVLVLATLNITSVSAASEWGPSQCFQREKLFRDVSLLHKITGFQQVNNELTVWTRRLTSWRQKKI